MISLEQYEVIGEFASHASGCDEGIPKLVQWWIPTEKVDDPNPANKRETPNRWCACLGDKYVELHLMIEWSCYARSLKREPNANPSLPQPIR